MDEQMAAIKVDQKTSAADKTTQVSNRDGKYLTFVLSREHYGLEIMKVREIIGMMDITAIPQTPLFVKGLINLRGKVIPVLDLRIKFGLEEKVYSERTAIIVVEIVSNSGPVQMGIVVDTVSEVMNISQNNIEPVPNFGTKLRTEYIMGMAKVKGKVVILLDMDVVMTDEELTLVGV